MNQEFVRVGNPRRNSKKTIFTLDVEEYIPILSPPKMLKMGEFNPNRYFITSGDAVNKAKQLSKDLWKYAGRSRQALNSLKKKHKNAVKFEKRCWVLAGKSKLLIQHLIDARGDSIFMETEWRYEHGPMLTCTPKNPRAYKKSKIALLDKVKS